MNKTIPTPATQARLETWETPAGFIPEYERVSGHETEVCYYHRNQENHTYWEAQEVIEDQGAPIRYSLDVGHYGQLSPQGGYRLISEVIQWANKVLPVEYARILPLGEWVQEGAHGFHSADSASGSVAALDIGTFGVTLRVRLEVVDAGRLWAVVSWLRDFFTVANGSKQTEVSRHE